MDKYEYRVRADEIRELISQGDYVQAAEIADTIDWRRVRSVKMLCTISDLYKINRRYEDARDMLLLAYECRPGGRNICYALCELSIKTGELVQAIEYYKEFVSVAPRDPGRYVLQYRLYEAQDVSLEERIEVLEELKKRDYREKWAYELAYLYHRIGLATRCVEECDELISMLGEGKYVIKAMELKMLHQPLTPSQQDIYDHRFDEPPVMEQPPVEPEMTYSEEVYFGEEAYTGEGAGAEGITADEGYGVPEGYEVPYESSVDYGTSENYGVSEDQEAPESYEASEGYQVSEAVEDTLPYEPVQQRRPAEEPEMTGTPAAMPNPDPEPETEESNELDIQVKTVDVGEYNTINLQAEIAQGLREVLGTEQRGAAGGDPITRSIMAPMMEDDEPPENEEKIYGTLEPAAEEMERSEVFFGETGNIDQIPETPVPEKAVELAETVPEKAVEIPEAVPEKAVELPKTVPDKTGEIVMRQMRQETIEESLQAVLSAEPPKEMAHVLAQESDGQISLVVPERQKVEKQITGQMNITDVLAEWERMKQENVEKRREDVRQRVLQQTGRMFTEFDAAARDGLLEQLEKKAEEAELEDSGEQEDFELIAGAEEPVAEEESVIAEEPITEELVIAEEPIAEEEFDITEEPIAEEESVIAEEPIVEEEPVVEEELLAAEEPVAEEELAAEEELVTEEEPAAEEEPVAQKAKPVRSEVKVRSMTKEERELYAPFIQSKAAREQIVKAIDGISLAAYTGNVIITGEEGMDTLSLAKNMVKEIQSTDSNFSGRTAKISGHALNKKDVADIIKQLQNGALIIQNACDMEENTVQELYKVLQQEDLGIVVLMEDTRKVMNVFLKENEQLLNVFTVRVDVEALSNDTLVAFGRQYAHDMEYSIDELGVLALHTRIEEKQTIDHAVTAPEVKEMVNHAIRHANKKNMKHFFDILFFKRYDEEDMIVLTERDFA